MKEFPYTPQDFLGDGGIRFIEGRYPFTYACDFIREHSIVVQAKVGINYLDRCDINSRYDASMFMKMLNDGEYDYDHIAVVFADAYLIENGITKP